MFISCCHFSPYDLAVLRPLNIKNKYKTDCLCIKIYRTAWLKKQCEASAETIKSVAQANEAAAAAGVVREPVAGVETLENENKITF